jgi:hypothetical protein
MCVMSMVHEYFRDNTKPAQWTPDAVAAFEKVAKMLDELDRILGQQECFDPFKAVWFTEIKAELEKLRPQLPLPFTITTLTVPATAPTWVPGNIQPNSITLSPGLTYSGVTSGYAGGTAITPTRGAEGELAQKRLAQGCQAEEEERFGRL